MPTWIDPTVDPEGAITQLQTAWDVLDGRVDQHQDRLRKIRDFVRALRRGKLRGLDGEREEDLGTMSPAQSAALKRLVKMFEAER